MNFCSKRYRSALVIQIMLAHINAIYSINLIPRNFLQYSERNSADYIFEDPRKRETTYNFNERQIEDEPSKFLRKTKSGNQVQMFSIDLSRLRQDTPIAHSTAKHKSPVSLLGIDISELSRNPDPSLPIAIKHPKEKVNGKFIMGYDFDHRFDRLPVIKTKPIRTYTSIPREDMKEVALLPMMHLPLKVLTTYNSILENKKHDIDIQFGDGSSIDTEREQKYTANFILYLLYQLSSNYNKT